MYVMHEYNSSYFYPMGAHIHNCPVALQHLRTFVSCPAHALTATGPPPPPSEARCPPNPQGRWLRGPNSTAPCAWDARAFPKQGELEACGYAWTPFGCRWVAHTSRSAREALTRQRVQRVLMTGDSLVEQMAYVARTVLGPYFSKFSKCHSLCQKPAKFKDIVQVCGGGALCCCPRLFAVARPAARWRC